MSLERIRRNPHQPRGTFEEQQLRELAASVAEHGILQPVLLTEVEGGYQLIAGERRVRAAEMAGLSRIPAVIRDAPDQDRLSLALVENLQRADLNAMDEARAFRRLIDDFGMTQEAIARSVGRSRPAIANTLRLLAVAASVQVAVEAGRVSEGHARALAALDDHEQQTRLLAIIESRALSVRQTESLVRDAATASPPRPADPPASADPDIERMEQRLRDALGTRVTLTPGRRGGRMTITWFDEDDLARLYERLAGDPS